MRDRAGNLQIAHFPTATAANVASRGRELPSCEEIASVVGVRTGGEIRHTEMARRLGLTPRQIRECYQRGGLPGAKEHSAYILVVPMRLLRLAEAYGLRAVERMAKAGLL